MSPIKKAAPFILSHLPGFLLALMIGGSALLFSAHFSLPATLVALIGGLSLSFIYQQKPLIQAGVNWSSGFVLRVGVVLLGLRIVLADFVALGWTGALMIVAAIASVITIGIIGARLLGLRKEFGILSGGAVSICGVSAAMALHSVLPHYKDNEHDLSLTIIGITAFSTLEMLSYPFLGQMLGLDTAHMGMLLGGTIHDMAQTAGAGFAVSDEVGQMAVLTKMIRVSFLVPVVLMVAISFKAHIIEDHKSKLPLPLFLIMFFVLIIANSTLAIPPALTDTAAIISKIALITSMAAIGLKTNLRTLFTVGHKPLLLIMMQVASMAAIILGFVLYL